MWRDGFDRRVLMTHHLLHVRWHYWTGQMRLRVELLHVGVAHVAVLAERRARGAVSSLALLVQDLRVLCCGLRDSKELSAGRRDHLRRWLRVELLLLVLRRLLGLGLLRLVLLLCNKVV